MKMTYFHQNFSFGLKSTQEEYNFAEKRPAYMSENVSVSVEDFDFRSKIVVIDR